MTIANVANSAHANGAGGTVTATYPGATTAGHLLVAIGSCTTGHGSSLALPAGWSTAVVQDLSTTAAGGVGIFYKVADGTETAITMTGASTCTLELYEFSGTAATSVVDGTPAGNNSAAATVATLATPSTTLTKAGSVVVVAVGTAANNGGTAVFGSATTLQQDAEIRVIAAFALPGATGAVTKTATWTTARAAGSVIAAFAPSSSTVVTGTATGSGGGVGAGVGRIIKEATATGAGGGTGAATGHRIVRGALMGSGGATGAATGKISVSGVLAGFSVTTGSMSGSDPAPAVDEGTRSVVTNVTTGDTGAITPLFKEGPPPPGTPVTVVAAADAGISTSAGETTKVATLFAKVPMSFISDGNQMWVKGAVAVSYIYP